MKKILIRVLPIIVIVLFCAKSMFAADFFGDTVHTVKVYFDMPSFWDSLLVTHDTENYIRCWVVFNGVDTIRNVGIRLKGNSSYNHPGNKKPFHLKFDEYIANQDYEGNERLSFNNCYHDPTFLREKLGCEVFHGLGVPCPRACWSVVYFNNTYWGFYSTTDPINRQALSRFFSFAEGNLYDCEQRAYMTWLGSSISLYTSSYLISCNEGTDDYYDLISFLNFLNNSDNTTFSNNVLRRFDAIGFARMWAANTFLVNLDSYQGFGRNYFFYFDHDTIGRYIVYDLNMAFGGFNQYGFSATQLRELAYDWYNTSGGGGFPPTPSGRPLFKRCIDNWTPFRGLVECALNELLETTLEYSTFAARVTTLANLVRPYVYADVNKEFTNAQFETNLDNDVSTGGPPGMGTIPGLRDFIYDRGISIASQIGPCGRTNVAGKVLINEIMASNSFTIADEAGQFEDWIELYNPADTAIDVSHWWVSDDFTEPRKWSLPAATIMPPHGYLLIWADTDPEQGPRHASFKLDAGREMVSLFGSDLIGAQFADSVSWRDLATDSTWGRFPNGSGTWRVCLVATPEAENIWSLEVADAGIKPMELAISAYPNPFNSALRIEISGLSHGEGISQVIQTEVLDISGRRVGSPISLAPALGSADRIAVVWEPADALPTGTYFIRATNGDRMVVEKVIYLK